MEQIINHLVSVLSVLLALWLVASLSGGGRPVGSALGWLAFILAIPYLGIPLYLAFGGRKLRHDRGVKPTLRRAPASAPVVDDPLERVIRSVGGPTARGGNRISLVEHGEAAYAEALALIGRARERIHLCTFILQPDPVGAAILDALTARAAEGLEVRLLLDAFGGLHTERSKLQALRDAGGQVETFMPLLHLPFTYRTNLRNHRKSLIIDGHTALVGGMNIGLEYMGPTPDPRRWVDLGVIVEGPVVADIDDVFAGDWAFAAGEPPGELSVPAARCHHDPLQVVAGGPDVPEDPIFDAFIAAISSSQHRIWLATPYFVPDPTTLTMLCLASRRGVDVRLLIPLRSNHRLADIARGPALRKLKAAGARVELVASMMHAKAGIFDDRLILGSANLDMRSLFLNFELCLVFYGGDLVEALAGWFERVPRVTVELARPSVGGRLVEGAVVALSPLL